MTALAEKLKEAGVDTIGPQLTTACVQALRAHPESIEAAWRAVGLNFGHALLRQLQSDMGLTQVAKPYTPRVQSLDPVRTHRRAEIKRAIRSKYLNSAGVPWSEVSWHELHGLARDGVEAKALLTAGPSNITNDGRTVGDVLGIKKIDSIIEALRK